jgi:predicted metal-dependent HD superfamily phosphohydrolase
MPSPYDRLVSGDDETRLHAAWSRWLPGRADAVIARYREPHRHYHTVRHLRAVVADVSTLLREIEVADEATVVAAAFFHDAVYEPRSSTNEADSAQLAASSLQEWPPARRQEVTRLIMATAGHEARSVHEDAAAAVLLDADLAVLGAEPARYEAYALGVRKEYAHVDDAGWRVGRAAVLEGFLECAVIYSTEQMRTREPRARANMAAELASLRA